MKLETKVVLGFTAIGIGLLLNPWLVGWLFLQEGHVGSAGGRIMIMLGELGLIILGLSLVYRRRAFAARHFMFTVLLIVAGLIIVEGGLHLVRVGRDLARGTEINKRITLSIYRDTLWAPTVFREYEQLELEFDQYLCWKTSAFEGVAISVGYDGIRRTRNPVTPATSSSEKVYFFGGSSIWGAYVPDHQTVPSFFAEIASDSGHRVNVLNCAERGYTFTQGVLHLALLLRAGHHPDQVIFVDGYNDMVAAYHIGRSGLVGLFPEMEKLVRFSRAPLHVQWGETLARWVAEHSMVFKACQGLAAMIGSPDRPSEEVLGNLAHGVADEYSRSYALLERLAEVYRFRFLCFLQPTLFSKHHLSQEEETADPVLKDEGLVCEETTKDLRSRHLSNLIEASFPSDSDSTTVFSDICHLSGKGNRELARTIFSIWCSP